MCFLEVKRRFFSSKIVFTRHYYPPQHFLSFKCLQGFFKKNLPNLVIVSHQKILKLWKFSKRKISTESMLFVCIWKPLSNCWGLMAAKFLSNCAWIWFFAAQTFFCWTIVRWGLRSQFSFLHLFILFFLSFVFFFVPDGNALKMPFCPKFASSFLTRNDFRILGGFEFLEGDKRLVVSWWPYGLEG